jgi:hypothetical protein
MGNEQSNVTGQEVKPFIDQCITLIRAQKKNKKSNTYIELTFDASKEDLEFILKALKDEFGSRLEMRLFDIQNKNLRLQIWWESYPRRSDKEFALGSYYDPSLSLNPKAFREYFCT